jgi:predicted PurR-regulated permease PerM
MENSDQAPPEALPQALPRPASRVEEVRALAAARGVPLAAILTTCGVVVVIYLAGKLAFQMRGVLLIIAVAGFLALALNPLVAGTQRLVKRRGWAVTIVLGWATLVFIGLAFLFGHPLVNGLTHLSQRLPGLV